MAKEEREESKVGSTASPSPQAKKKPLNGMKKSSSSALNRYPLRLRNPDLYNCHVCGCQICTKGGKDRLRTLDSQWRIIIICTTCFKNVQSAKTCSYCFSDINTDDEVGINCCVCNRRVHEGCVSMYKRINSCFDSGSFNCIDCWVPRSFNKTNGCSRSSRVESNLNLEVRVCSKDKSLEDEAKDARTTAELKLANAARAREKALEKAVAARRAAKMAANALDLAAVTATEESQVRGCCPVVDDAELALRLHRAINSSPRIFKNIRSTKLDNLVDPKMSKLGVYSLATQSDPGSRSVSNLEVGIDKLILENPDKAASEPFVQIGTLEPRTNMESNGSPGEHRKNGKVGRVKNSERVSGADLVKMSDDQDCVAELPMKEEQASCSSKVTISHGNYNSTGSVSQYCQHQEILNHNVALNNRGTQCQSIYDNSVLDEPDRFLRKYSRKFHGPNKFKRKYSRRCTNSKATFDWKANVLPETFHLETQASGTALPLMQNDKELLTSNDTCVPSQASTYASSQS